MYTLLSGPMVYTLFPCFPRKRVYTIASLFCDLGVGRQTEKRGVPRWWCILFFPEFSNLCGGGGGVPNLAILQAIFASTHTKMFWEDILET